MVDSVSLSLETTDVEPVSDSKGSCPSRMYKFGMLVRMNDH